MGEPLGSRDPLVHVVQLRARSQNASLARPQWKQASPTTYGVCENFWRPLDRRISLMAKTSVKPINQKLADYQALTGLLIGLTL
jgi:hypothetical protein